MSRRSCSACGRAPPPPTNATRDSNARLNTLPPGVKRLDETGAGVLSGKQSALYPVLRNLAAAGLLDSEVEPSVTGPPRRYYRITPLGRRVLREWSLAWISTRDFVNSVLED